MTLGWPQGTLLEWLQDTYALPDAMSVVLFMFDV